MIESELREACRKARANLAAIDMDPDTARLVVVVPGHRRRERARLWRGVTGRVVGIDHDREGRPITVVDVLVADIERSLGWTP